jgi:hypothetical protein
LTLQIAFFRGEDYPVQAAMIDLEISRAICSLTDKQRQIVGHGDRVSRLSKKQKPRFTEHGTLKERSHA